MSRRDGAWENRLEALRKLRDARGRAVKIHHSTGAALLRDDLAARTSNGRWRSTERGVKYIDDVERTEEVVQTSSKCLRDKALQDRQKKALDWLDLHVRLTFAARSYAKHVVEALLTGERVRESGHAWKDGDELCRAWVETALDAIEQLEQMQADAYEAGGDITVSYGVGEPVRVRGRRRRGEAVEAIAERKNIVRLDAWKEARA